MARSLLPHDGKPLGSRPEAATANEIDLVNKTTKAHESALNERFDSVRLDSPCRPRDSMADDQQRYPKRKRQEIKYFDTNDESEDEDSSQDEGSDDEGSSNKVGCSSSLLLQCTCEHHYVYSHTSRDP